MCRLRRRVIFSILISIVAFAQRTDAGGFFFNQPAGYLKVQSEKRSNVFYVGEPVRFALSGSATTYQVRDYCGKLVDQGIPTQGTSINPNVTYPGWYKLYVYGSKDQGDPWRQILGGTTFVIFRNNSNFPPLSPPDGNPYNDGEDEVIRGVTGMGPQRFYVYDAANPASDIARLQRLIAIDKQMYLPFDPLRNRKLLIAFPNGTGDPTAVPPVVYPGVLQVINTFKNDVQYFEPRNEPNFGNSQYSGNATDFVNKELIPFYNAVKSVNPSLKALGPGIVTIGPYGLNWITEFLGAGGANYIDAFSFHAYNNVNGDPFLAQESLDGLKALLNQYGKSNIELWQTEQGYMAAVYGSYQPRLQGRWTMVQMMVYEQYGIPKEHNHLWYDRSHGFWSEPMWWENDDSSLNPAAPLMRVWSEELYGTTFTSAYDFGQPGNHMYLGSLFNGPGKSVATFMSWGSTDGQVDLAVTGGSSIHYVTSYGLEYDFPVTQGHVTIPVPELPVYIELAPGQTIHVNPTNWGSNLALQQGVTAGASGTGVSPLTYTTADTAKLFNGYLENWYYQQNPGAFPWMDNTQGFPAWVELDMPSSQTIDHVVVYANSSWQLTGTLIDYELQYDASGQWVTLEHVQEPVNTFKVYSPEVSCTVDSFFSDRWVFQHSFAPVQTGKIRLLVHNLTWGGGATQDVSNAGGQTGPPNITLQEIEIYNASANSQQTAVSVLPGITSPLVSIGSPANGTTFSAPANITISASALETKGGFSKVEFFANGTKLGESTGGQFNFTWYDVSAGQYALTAKVTDSNGVAVTTSPVNITVGVTGNESGLIAGSGIGLLGQYFQDTNLTFPQSTRLDSAVDFDWGSNNGYGVPSFSARWTGQVEPKYSETYTFYTQNDDGARLWVNGQLLVNDWNAHSAAENSGTITLQKGRRYDIRVEYFQGGGGASMKLLWASQSQTKEIIPTGQLCPPVFLITPSGGSTYTAPANINLSASILGTGGPVSKVEFYADSLKVGQSLSEPYTLNWSNVLTGTYALTAVAYSGSGTVVTSVPVNVSVNAPGLSTPSFGTGTGLKGDYFSDLGLNAFVLSRLDPAVNFDWAGGSPDPLLSSQTFSARWTGQIQPRYSETYTFYTKGDDGARLWINGQQIVDDWTAQGPTEYSGTISLQHGQLYDIRLEYFQSGGGDSIGLSWSSLSQPKETVPASQLYPAIAINTPADGTAFSVSDSITITASNVDTAALAKVEFFAGGAKLGEATGVPYSIYWNNAAAGQYTLTAKAVRSDGSSVTSSPVNIIVTASGTQGFASYVKTDSSTQGNWINTYGADGFNVIGTTPSYPAYAVVTPGGNSLWTWAASTNDIRALQKSGGSDRISACWYTTGTNAGSSYLVDVIVTDGLPHSLALYAADWDNYGGFRSETVEILDANSGTVLDTRWLSPFKSGEYLVWNISGHVKIRVTNKRDGTNAIITGLFFAPSLANPPAEAAWKLQNFSSADLGDPNISGDSADWDKDGLPTLAEYAFNLDPKKFNSGVLKPASVYIGGNNYLYLSHPQSRVANDVSLRYEVSNDLHAWTGVTPEIVSWLQVNALTDMVTVRVPATNPPLFIRVKVVKTTPH